MTAQLVGIVWAVLMLILIGRSMRGRMVLAATAFGLAFVVTVVWLERAGYWPRSWRSEPAALPPAERTPIVPEGLENRPSQRV